MKSIFNILTISGLLLGVVFSGLLKKEEFTKSINKEFTIEADGEVRLSNQYGKIDIRTTSADKVTVDVQIVVNAKSESVAQDVFETISIDFENSSSYVMAKTNINTNKSWWGNSWKNYDMQINYSVNVPETVELDVDNKYGDVYITELENDLSLEVDYGKFIVGSAHDIDLDSKYSSGKIEICRNLTADLAYVSEGLEIDQCDAAEMDTKYSKIKIKKAQEIVADAGYDKYDIGEVQKFEIDGNYNKVILGSVAHFTADSRYTNIDVEEVTQYLDADLAYGGLDVINVRAGFESINVDSDYGSVKIRMDANASYSVDLSADYAGITVDDNIKVEYREKDGQSNRVKGYKGSGGGKVVIDSDYGSITVR